MFDNVNILLGTAGSGASLSSFEVKSAYCDSANTQDQGGRLVQFSLRVSWQKDAGTPFDECECFLSSRGSRRRL